MSIAMPVVQEPTPGPAAPAPQREAWQPNGRLKIENLSETDRNFAIAMHLTPYACLLGVGPLAFLAPVILWLVRKDRSAYNDDHGREMVNFMLSFVVLHVILALTIIGILALPVLWVMAVVNTIRGAIAAGKGEYYRYPATIRFLN